MCSPAKWIRPAGAARVSGSPDAAPNAPPWFQETAVLPAASGANPAWGVTLRPGRYALVCVLDRSSALYALTELTIG